MKAILINLLLLTACVTWAQKPDQALLDHYFETLVKNNKFMGAVAVSDSYNGAFGFSDREQKTPLNLENQFKVGSVSKMFTAVMVLKAVEEKKLSLETKLSQYYPTLENADKISIQNLLNHSSGIYSITSEADYLSWNTKPSSETDFLNRIQKHKAIFEPNTKHQYSNSNYILLSYILEKVYKKPYATVLRQKITQPLDLNNTYILPKKTSNLAKSYVFTEHWSEESDTHYTVPQGAGAIISTPSELVSFIQAVFNYKIIHKASLDKMLNFSQGYGLGIFDLSTPGRRAYGHDGAIDGYRSILKIFPDQNIAYAVIANGLNYGMPAISTTLESAIFENKVEIPSFEIVKLNQAELDKLKGTFSSKNFPLKITISSENLNLKAKATGQSAFILDAVAKDVFTFDKAGIKLSFKEDGNKMILSQGGKEFEFTKE